MVVDDSPVTRRLVERVLSRHDGLEVVAQLGDGRQAAEVAIAESVDVLVLDLEMPEIDGQEVLAELSAARAQLGVVIYSGAEPSVLDDIRSNVYEGITCTILPKSHAAGVGIQGLSARLLPLVMEAAGRRKKWAPADSPAATRAKAASKKTSSRAQRSSEEKPEAAQKASAAAPPSPVPKRQRKPASKAAPKAKAKAAPEAAAQKDAPGGRPLERPLAPLPAPKKEPAQAVTAAPKREPRTNASAEGNRFDIVVIGSSTGGPEALRVVIQALPKDLAIPVVIVQHMPVGFTEQLADRLDSQSEVTVREAKDGERLEAGCVLIAPGGKHLEVHQDGPYLRTQLTTGEPENSCRPAVDVLFRTTAAAARRHTLAVVLTGMGQDGLLGAGLISECGGTVIVQDEETSVVWGMPGAIAKAGGADEVRPLSEVAGRIAAQAKSGRSARRAS